MRRAWYCCLFTELLLVVGGSPSSFFPCAKLPARNSTTTSVRSLHPQDVSVVMALGDSITAGFGMLGATGSLQKDLFEYRGMSWSIGGDNGAETLPNFLRHYNPELIGASVGKHEVEVCWGYLCVSGHKPAQDHLNGAQTGAMLYNVVESVGDQVDYLITQLKSNPRVNMDEDWKVLTLLIGANEMCVQCEVYNIQPSSPVKFEHNYQQLLTKLHDRIPRLFVNTVLLFNVSEVYDVSMRSPRCEKIHRYFFVECSCAFENGTSGEKHRHEMNVLAQEYNKVLERVSKEFMRNVSDDFAVVVQPALRDGTAETFPLEFISTLDCFHPSMLAHQMMAKVLWNNMMTPAAKKKTTFAYNDPFICPTEDSIFPID